MGKKPNKLVRLLRRWILKQCPYCKAKLERALSGMFLHGFYGCPNGHYGEEDVMGAGTLVYDNGGEIVFEPKAARHG